MEENKNKNYKDETKSAFIGFLCEASGYAFVIVTLILTGSLSLFMDLINSTCNVLRTAFTSFLAKRLQKNLKFKYNYGTAKLETLSMIFCDFLLVIGTLFVFGFAIYRLFNPGEPNDALLFGVILKSINISVGLYLVIMGYCVYKKTKTKVAKSSFEATLGGFCFDLAIFLSILFAFIFVDWKGVVYIEPISSIVIAIFIIYKAIKRIATYIKEVVDLTIPEEEQLKIDKLLIKYLDKYQSFYSVNSHKVGDLVYVDFHLSFEDNTPYVEIKNTLKLFTEELEKNFEECKVSIIIED